MKPRDAANKVSQMNNTYTNKCAPLNSKIVSVVEITRLNSMLLQHPCATDALCCDACILHSLDLFYLCFMLCVQFVHIN